MMSPAMNQDVETGNKYSRLATRLREIQSLLVAYSGGVDSAVLLHAATIVLGDHCRAVIADSPSLPRAELADALALAQRHGWRVEVLATQELDNPAYAANPLNRCYYCKHELFDQMHAYARQHGFTALAYGENADDAHEFRPGQQAAQEFQILAPLREADLTKADVRALARDWQLEVADKPAAPCLSSRLPTGHAVTREALAQIEAGEILLRQAGFRIVRLRNQGDWARIQVSPEETPRLLSLRDQLTPGLLALGFKRLEFDPTGYQGASLR